MGIDNRDAWSRQQKQFASGMGLAYETTRLTVAIWTRKRLMRRLMALLLAVPGACATQGSTDFSYTARFPEFPGHLYRALEESCSEPAQKYQRFSRNHAECREYLEPEATAAIILSYDGTPEDLPQLIMRFKSWADGQEFLLRTDAYLNVPQKSGGPIHVVFPSGQFNRTLKQLYRLSGGVPE